ncbi:MAG: HK97 family phage prohead protease, partial [Burkholderiaceae bacterium]
MQVDINKATDPKWLYVSGIATTDTADRAGDIVKPDGVKVRGKLKLLSQHDHDKPIGEILNLKRVGNAWRIEARLPRDSGLAYVQDAIKQLEAGLVSGFSIGFKPLRTKRNEGGRGLIFEESEVYEVSLVTIPCNPDAEVTAVKQATPTKPKRKYTREELAARVNELTGKNTMQTKAATEAHNVTNAAPLLREDLKIETAPIESRFIGAGLQPLAVEQITSVATVALSSAGGTRGFPQVGKTARSRSEQIKRHCEALLTRELEEAAPGALDAALAAEVAKALDVAAVAFFAGKATAAASQTALIEAAAKMTAPVAFVSPSGLAALVEGDYLENGKAFGVFPYVLLPHATGFKYLILDTASAYMGARIDRVQNMDEAMIEGEGGSKVSAFQCDLKL